MFYSGGQGHLQLQKQNTETIQKHFIYECSYIMSRGRRDPHQLSPYTEAYVQKSLAR